MEQSMSSVVVDSVAAHMPSVVPHSCAPAKVLVLRLFEPAAEVADRLGVRDSLKDAQECDHSDGYCEDDHQASPSAAKASASHRVTFVQSKLIGATLRWRQCA